ncbi:hypothetical protein KQX54_004381 [Cotesia glomerata]|uniref:Uncharacterized protein n=1 Tax=Cotesia glomerata TaxID=32391 RepID=A0AAV7I6U4_COTGL|nr:hypothetical protein KQX54_004381 [Cotesia glomerata]
MFRDASGSATPHFPFPIPQALSQGTMGMATRVRDQGQSKYMKGVQNTNALGCFFLARVRERLSMVVVCWGEGGGRLARSVLIGLGPCVARAFIEGEPAMG